MYDVYIRMCIYTWIYTFCVWSHLPFSETVHAYIQYILMCIYYTYIYLRKYNMYMNIRVLYKKSVAIVRICPRIYPIHVNLYIWYIYIYVCIICVWIYTFYIVMGWLPLVGSLKLQVSFAKEPYKRDYILQKRPTILRSLLIVAAP